MSLLSEVVNWLFIVSRQHASQFSDGSRGFGLMFLHHSLHSFLDFIFNTTVTKCPSNRAAFYLFEHFVVFLLDALDEAMQVVNLGSHVFELKFFLLHAQLI
jgi:hypothetical protein